ncbi:MAG: aminotransferase class I/II-fold pyridoxal phosphate-dependent enzyme [Bacteroidales bacterium OttesenSCG-928-I14]|jgi:aspartate/methionine/tyrosine aminotransferase|nr:aminotransferase class I/II-fold pyridoxal phosphate-dependent enzyme [Bacteroidales bacterium OttesenSCG-928-I14]
MEIKKIIPARRLNTISEYFFSKKLNEINRMDAQGADVINLGVGNPDLPPSKTTIDILCHFAQQADVHGYQPYNGILELRQAFAGWYKQYYRVNLNPNVEIQPLIGSKEGILHISLAFLNPGDSVLIPNPGYITYRTVSNLIEAKVIDYDLVETNNWHPDFDELEKLDLSKVKLMWVNYPNMPTGTLATKQLFQKLVDFGKNHNIVICNDNPYSFILNETPLSILEIEGAKDICIELNSLSKSHNMPGWRIAMLASNKLFVQWILKIKSNIDSGQFKPMMLAAIQSLQAPKEWYTTINKIYRQRWKIVKEIMNTLNCTIDPQQFGMFIWGKIPNNYKNGNDLSNKILHQANVFITPGFIFGSNGNKYIRASLCCKENRLKEALNRIKNI